MRLTSSCAYFVSIAMLIGLISTAVSVPAARSRIKSSAARSTTAI